MSTIITATMHRPLRLHHVVRAMCPRCCAPLGHEKYCRNCGEKLR